VLLTAHQNPMQERWGGGEAQVIGQALSIWGINKQASAESPFIPKLHTAPNLTAQLGRSQPIGRLRVLSVSAQSLTKH
jgi:hypothetical protein